MQYFKDLIWERWGAAGEWVSEMDAFRERRKPKSHHWTALLENSYSQHSRLDSSNASNTTVENFSPVTLSLKIHRFKVLDKNIILPEH